MTTMTTTMTNSHLERLRLEDWQSPKHTVPPGVAMFDKHYRRILQDHLPKVLPKLERRHCRDVLVVRFLELRQFRLNEWKDHLQQIVWRLHHCPRVPMTFLLQEPSHNTKRHRRNLRRVTLLLRLWIPISCRQKKEMK